jgi:ABC-type lipoprotein release transport system permease subunit
MAVAAVAVGFVTTVAAWLPTRRAARVNPTIALQ